MVAVAHMRACSSSIESSSNKRGAFHKLEDCNIKKGLSKFAMALRRWHGTKPELRIKATLQAGASAPAQQAGTSCTAVATHLARLA